MSSDECFQKNGGNNEGLVTEEENDQVVTLEEIVDESNEIEEEARMLLGGQDESACTYPEGYKPRQAIYSCLTCTSPPDVQGAVCFGCSLRCHDGHRLVELYTKRLMRCDCGNSKFGDGTCQLYEDKSVLNERNVYNQNFEGVYCTQRCVYEDSDSDEAMIQCVLCEDWFHLSHLGLSEIPPDDDLVCTSCATKWNFLKHLKTAGSDSICVSSLHSEDDCVEQHALILSPSEKWRDRICQCSNCNNFLEEKNLDYLRDENDLMSQYVGEASRKTEDERLTSQTSFDIAQDLAREKGPEAALHVMQGLNTMKTELHRLFASCAEKNEAVTKEDITALFNRIKRRRIDDNSCEN